MHALQHFNKMIVHSDDGLEGYNLDLMTRVAIGTGRPQDLDASRERIAEQNAAIVLARTVKVGGRNISKQAMKLLAMEFHILCPVMYATKSFMQVTLHATEITMTDLSANPRRSTSTSLVVFRSFGEVR